MTFTKTTKTVTTDHPLEEFLNITPGTTEKNITVVDSSPVAADDYDGKDKQLDTEYQQISNMALSAYEEMLEMAIDSKQPARMAEVAAQFLNIALDSVNKKANHKQHKDKINVRNKAKPSKTVNNNLIISRNDLLNKIKTDHIDVIDGEIVEIPEDTENE